MSWMRLRFLVLLALGALLVSACTGRGGRRRGSGTDGGTTSGDASTEGDGGAECLRDSDCEHLSSECGTASCNTATGACETSADAEDGTACDDGDACTSGDQCLSGACVGEAMDCSYLDDACLAGECNPATGSCVAAPLAEGAECDDGDACTDGDSCAAGDCVPGAETDCSEMADACNVAMCDPDTGCYAEPVSDGTSCSDGDACTTGDVCVDGTCGGAARDCSHLDDDCNTGVCAASSGTCTTAPVADSTLCDDGDACTAIDRCSAGTCTGTSPVDCSSFTDACNVGTCDAGSGCYAAPVTDGTLCSDGDSCTVGDACSSGVCTGTNTCCGIQDFQLSEVYGYSPDYIEIVNTGTCTLSTSGLYLSFRLGCDSVTQTYAFPARDVAPGAHFRVVDVSTGLSSNEVYYGDNLCHYEYEAAWVALCDGPCSASCTNYLDYFEQSGSSGSPVSTPTCADFTPSPLYASGASYTQSATRIGYTGSGAAGRQADWALQTYSRTTP